MTKFCAWITNLLLLIVAKRNDQFEFFGMQMRDSFIMSNSIFGQIELWIDLGVEIGKLWIFAPLLVGLSKYGFFNVRYGTENTGKRSVRTRTYGPYVRTCRFLAITRKRSLQFEK